MTIEEIVKALENKKPSVVSRDTGVKAATIRGIARGANKNPTYNVYTALVKYLSTEKAK